MKTIVIKTQKELDELPSGFDEYTLIKIKSSERIIVRHAYNNASVVAFDTSLIEVYDNSVVITEVNSSIVAHDNASTRVE